MHRPGIQRTECTAVPTNELTCGRGSGLWSASDPQQTAVEEQRVSHHRSTDRLWRMRRMRSGTWQWECGRCCWVAPNRPFLFLLQSYSRGLATMWKISLFSNETIAVGFCVPSTQRANKETIMSTQNGWWCWWANDVIGIPSRPQRWEEREATLDRVQLNLVPPLVIISNCIWNIL